MNKTKKFLLYFLAITTSAIICLFWYFIAYLIIFFSGILRANANYEDLKSTSKYCSGNHKDKNLALCILSEDDEFINGFKSIEENEYFQGWYISSKDISKDSKIVKIKSVGFLPSFSCEFSVNIKNRSYEKKNWCGYNK